MSVLSLVGQLSIRWVCAYWGALHNLLIPTRLDIPQSCSLLKSLLATQHQCATVFCSRSFPRCHLSYVQNYTKLMSILINGQINTWVSGDVTEAVLEATTWNWGIGMWAIIYFGKFMLFRCVHHGANLFDSLHTSFDGDIVGRCSPCQTRRYTRTSSDFLPATRLC